jgi:hypothetical protein
MSLLHAGCRIYSRYPDGGTGCSCTAAGTVNRQVDRLVVLQNVYVECSATYNVDLVTDDVNNHRTYIRNVTSDVLVFARAHLKYKAG